MKQLFTKAIAVAIACAAVQTSHAQTAVEPIRVGFINPLTGGSQDFGNSARLGAEMAVKEINEVGGYLGRPIQLIERDDQSTPEVGRRVAEDLVLKEHVAFTLGFTNTGVALKALDVFQTHKSLLVVPVSTGSAVTAQYPAKDSYIFRLSARDTLQASLIVDDIIHRGLNKIAIFADKTGYGDGGLSDLKTFLGQHGVTPIYVSRFDLGVKSLTQEVQEAKAAGAQAIIGYSVAPELTVLMRSRAEAKFGGLVYGSWPLSSHTVWERAGTAAEGAIMVQTIIQDISNERRSTFMARLRHFAGRQQVGSLMAAAQTYDAMYLMLHAMFQTRGNTKGDALKQALEHMDRPYTGVVTDYVKPFSPQDHDAYTRNMIWLGVWRKGEVVFLYPEDAKRAGFIRRKEVAR